MGAFNRDHFEDTPFDLTRGPASGPHGDPSRYDAYDTMDVYTELGRPEEGVNMETMRKGKYERGISIMRTASSYSVVAGGRVEGQSAPPNSASQESLGTELSDPEIDTVVWYSQYAPHASVYTPVPVGASKAPVPLSVGSHHRVNKGSMYWAAALIGNWADRLYIHTRADVAQAQVELESQCYDRLVVSQTKAKAAKRAAGAGVSDVERILDQHTETSAAANLEAWMDLFWALAAKFKDGQRLDDAAIHKETLLPTKLFYPESWLESNNYFD